MISPLAEFSSHEGVAQVRPAQVHRVYWVGLDRAPRSKAVCVWDPVGSGVHVLMSPWTG